MLKGSINSHDSLSAVSCKYLSNISYDTGGGGNLYWSLFPAAVCGEHEHIVDASSERVAKIVKSRDATAMSLF